MNNNSDYENHLEDLKKKLKMEEKLNGLMEKEREKEREIEEENKRRKKNKRNNFVILSGILYSLGASVFLTFYAIRKKGAFDYHSYVLLLPFLTIGLVSISFVFFSALLEIHG